MSKPQPPANFKEKIFPFINTIIYLLFLTTITSGVIWATLDVLTNSEELFLQFAYENWANASWFIAVCLSLPLVISGVTFGGLNDENNISHPIMENIFKCICIVYFGIFIISVISLVILQTLSILTEGEMNIHCYSVNQLVKTFGILTIGSIGLSFIVLLMFLTITAAEMLD